MRKLFPYPVLVGEVDLEIRQARLDDVPVEFSMISASQRTVALHEIERTSWQTAVLEVRARVPRRELDSGPWTNVTYAAMLFERRTNVRTVFSLTPEQSGSWVGEVVLHRDRHLGRAELAVQVVGTVGGVDGRLIGQDRNPWTIDLLASTPAKKHGVKMVWVDFSSEENAHLLPFRTDPWAVDTSGDEPTLYLNKRFEGLEALLGSGRAADRDVQNLLLSHIAKDTWTTLFNSAVQSVQTDDRGRPEWPGGWRENTLRRMLPDILPDHSPDDALKEIVTRLSNDDGGGDLHTRVLHAAAVQARLTRNLGGFVRALRRSAQEEDQ